MKNSVMGKTIYKKTGISILTKGLPGHLGAVRLKYLTKGRLQYGMNVVPANYKSHGVRFLRTTDINDEGKVSGEGVYLDAGMVPESHLLKKGDVLFSRSGTIGRGYFHQSDVPMTYAGFLVRFRLGDVELAKWVYYYSKTPAFKQVLYSQAIRTTIQNFNGQKYNNISIPCNPLYLSINRYLDDKTGKIDRFVGLKVRLVSSLKAYRQAIVGRAVTRGLRPGAALKDSGTEWLGQIPEHWEVRRLKYLGFSFGGLSGKTLDDFSNEKKLNKYYIPFTNIAHNTFIDAHQLAKVFISENEKQHHLIKGDLLFLMSSETAEDIGKSALLNNDLGEVYLNSFCRGVRVTDSGLSPNYLVYLLNSKTYKDKLAIEGKGFTRINLKKGNLMKLHILLPPLAEQRAIARYLDGKTSKIDSLIAYTETKIRLMKAYKGALILGAVSGRGKSLDCTK